MLDVYDDIGWGYPTDLTCDKLMPGMGIQSDLHHDPLPRSTAILRILILRKAYQACLKSETDYVGRPAGVGKKTFKYFWEKGYVPMTSTIAPADSHTLEYSYTCWVTVRLP